MDVSVGFICLGCLCGMSVGDVFFSLSMHCLEVFVYSVFGCVCVCVSELVSELCVWGGACVHACVRACMRACMRACVRACVYYVLTIVDLHLFTV